MLAEDGWKKKNMLAGIGKMNRWCSIVSHAIKLIRLLGMTTLGMTKLGRGHPPYLNA